MLPHQHRLCDTGINAEHPTAVSRRRQSIIYAVDSSGSNGDSNNKDN